MLQSELIFRVRYCEVDRMGYVHHGNYAAYFEMGRTELMRQYGITYKEMEDNGILLPLSELSIKFHRPAFYDEELRLETTLSEYTGVRLIFDYKIFNSKNELLAEGKTPLAFVGALTRKPIKPTPALQNKLMQYFPSR